MSWRRVLFVVIVALALAWVFGLGPWVQTQVDGMNGGQHENTVVDPG